MLVGMDHLVAVKKGQLAINLKHSLNNKHHIGTASVIFVEYQRHRILQRPRQNPFTKFGHLLAVTQHDRIFADQVDAADMAVKIDPDAGPVQACGNLFDMGRFAGAVIALDHHPAVVGKARQDGKGGVGVELVVGIKGRHIIGPFTEGWHDHVNIDAECITRVDLDIWRRQHMGWCWRKFGVVRHNSSNST